MFNLTRSEKEREYAHKLADDLKKRLFTSTILGVLTVVTTGITAAFGYYTRDLPATIKNLTISVESLRGSMAKQDQTNEKQDFIQNSLEKRVTHLEQTQ